MLPPNSYIMLPAVMQGPGIIRRHVPCRRPLPTSDKIARVYPKLPRWHSGGIIWGIVVRRHVVWGNLEQFPLAVWTSHRPRCCFPIGSDPLMVHEIVCFWGEASAGSDQCRETISRSSLTDPTLSRACGVGPKAASQRRTVRWGRSPFNRCRHFTRCRRARPIADQHDDIHFCRCAGLCAWTQ